MLLEELKQSNPIHVTSHFFKFDYYYLQLIIMDDCMHLLVSHCPIMLDISVSKHKCGRLTNTKISLGLGEKGRF